MESQSQGPVPVILRIRILTKTLYSHESFSSKKNIIVSCLYILYSGMFNMLFAFCSTKEHRSVRIF